MPAPNRFYLFAECNPLFDAIEFERLCRPGGLLFSHLKIYVIQHLIVDYVCASTIPSRLVWLNRPLGVPECRTNLYTNSHVYGAI